MSFVLNNPNYKNYFETAWRNYLAELQRQNKNLPARISPGFLQELAAKNNLCISVFLVEGEYRVCGRDLSKYPGSNAWRCSVCEELLEKIAKQRQKELNLEQQEKPF